MTIQLNILGIPIDVTPHDPQQLGIEEALALSWSRCLRTESVAPLLTVWCALDQDAHDAPTPSDSLTVISAHEIGMLRSILTSRLTLLGIEELAGSSLLFHATASADLTTGRVTALVGPSGRGKTTAAQAMGRQQGYVTDETVAVMPDRSVTPYPKPLSVKADAYDTVKTQVGPDALALAAPTPGIPLTLDRIVLLHRDPDCDVPELAAVPLGQAIVELSTEMSYLWKYPAPLANLARLISETGGVLSARYAEATALPELLATTPPPALDSQWDEPSVSITGAELPSTAGRYFRFFPSTDAITIDGEILTLVGQQVILLSPIGSLIWSIAQDWISITEIHRNLVESFGPHPDSLTLVEDALRDLVEQDIVEHRQVDPAAS